MKTIIYEIGVLDKNGIIHKVMLREGLNIITGKSSTGKSAIIEIFDYCFASSEYNIPKGVITDVAELYYLYIQINNAFFVLGRYANKNNKCFFSREENYIENKIGNCYFDDRKSLTLINYKEQLNKLFIDLTDVDESIMAKEYRGKAQGRPSVRDFMSFNLQHQNLIANKHALFYRFDEKEKRDRIIKYTRIFLGFVDQQFYILLQKKEEIEYKLKQLNREKKFYEKYRKEKTPNIKYKLNIISALMGIDKLPITHEDILQNPSNAKEILDKFITVDKIIPDSDKGAKYYQELYSELDENNIRLKESYIKRDSIKESLYREKLLSRSLSHADTPDNAILGSLECPLCHSKSDTLTDSAKALNDAIVHLSDRLILNTKLKSQLEVSLRDVENDIKDIKSRNKIIKNAIEKISYNNKLPKLNTQVETLGMAKGELFFMIDNLSGADNNSEEDINELNNEIEVIKRKLNKYNVEHEITKAENRINSIMADIAKELDFEEGYKPTNLKFSLGSFDLYHEANNSKIYLRAMGSGANWLYSHITLFLALHQYFIENNKCVIPSVLFFDQPTQVYFPNFKKDNYEVFDKKIINELEKNQEHYDEDIRSVEKLFMQLALYCKRLKEKYGYSPQIIITDHADDLYLGDDFRFEDFVNNNRWRKRGFIDR